MKVIFYSHTYNASKLGLEDCDPNLSDSSAGKGVSEQHDKVSNPFLFHKNDSSASEGVSGQHDKGSALFFSP